MLLHIVRAAWLALLIAFPAAPSVADDAAWALMNAPGHVVLMRHAEAPGFSDPRDMKLGDCASQRNLDEGGRAQARRIGAALTERGIGFDRVLSSQWCRCLETAELVAGRKPEELPALNSFFGDRSVAPARVEAISAFLRSLPRESRVLMVTHQVVIQALAGVATRSGEMVVLRIGKGGLIELAGTTRVE